MLPSRKPPVEWSRRLVFAWPAGQPYYFVLPSMIFVAAVLHVLALGLVRLRYLEPRESRLAPATVQILPWEKDLWQGPAQWMQVADPAIFAASRLEQPLQQHEVAVAYSPSYLLGRMNWLAPEEEQATELPEVSSLVRPVRVRPFPKPSREEVPAPRRTAEGRLQVRGEAVLDLPLPAALAGKPLPPAPAIFLVEVGEEGWPHYVFLEKTSGSTDWDVSAEVALRGQVLPASLIGSWVRVALGPMPLRPRPLPGSADPALQQ